MKRKSRKGLRPVTATQYQKELKGYFHCFCQEGGLEDGIYTYAVIELYTGSVMQVDVHTLKFDDVEGDE